MLGSCCCTRAFSSCSVQGPLFVVVCGLSLWWRGFCCEACRLSGCGAQAQLPPWHMGSSWTRDRTHVFCIGRRILKHRITTEVSCCSWLTSTTKEGSYSRLLLPHWTHSQKLHRAAPAQDPHKPFLSAKTRVSHFLLISILSSPQTSGFLLCGESGPTAHHCSGNLSSWPVNT